MSKARAVFTASMLVLALVAPLAYALAQSAPPTNPLPGPREPISVNMTIEKYDFKLIVYGDGAVEPIVELKADAKSSKPLPVNGSLKIDYSIKYLEDLYEENTFLSIVLEGAVPLQPPPAQPAPLAASSRSLEASFIGNLSLDGRGGLVALSKGYIIAGNKSSRTILEVEKIEVVKKGSKLVIGFKASTNATMPRNISIRDPRKLFEDLEKAGIDFVKLESIIGGIQENKTIMELKISVDLEKLVAYAQSKGLKPSEAEEARRLLELPYKLKGEYRLDLKASSGKRATLEARLYDKYVGEVEKAYRDLAGHVAVLQKLLLVVALGITEDLRKASGEQEGQPIAPLLAAAPITPPKLILKPPSNQKISIELKIEKNTLGLKVVISGGRYTYYPESPSPDKNAEKTLIEIRRTIGQIENTLRQLKLAMMFTGIRAKGLEGLAPSTVVLEPGEPSVSLSAKKVSVDKLDSVTVTIKETKPVKTTTTTTTTSKPPEAETRTPTTTTTTSSTSVGQQAEKTTAQPPSQTPASTSAEKPGQEGGQLTLVAGAIVAIIVVAAIALLVLLKRK